MANPFIDILLLQNESHDLIAEHSVYLPINSRLSLKYDTVISIITIPGNDFNKKRSPAAEHAQGRHSPLSRLEIDESLTKTGQCIKAVEKLLRTV